MNMEKKFYLLNIQVYGIFIIKDVKKQELKKMAWLKASDYNFRMNLMMIEDIIILKKYIRNTERCIT